MQVDRLSLSPLAGPDHSVEFCSMVMSSTEADDQAYLYTSAVSLETKKSILGILKIKD